jgi:hypothetical protein
MRITVHIPAYYARGEEPFAGKDYPARQVDLNFPGIPPKGFQLSIMAQDARGAWVRGLVSIDTVRGDPGWKMPANVPAEGECWFMEAFTSWIDRPGK